ncbi:hypothetical protein H5410_033838 [Solanum commersonii]|uniref:Uncharacterized protein n=1 Tax=Solanum commersonii TaxID=4109 RepID=A0A9J5YTS3_SOLCO|nr:hypothetical protein H5410_033838 [Solanum commersonii]
MAMVHQGWAMPRHTAELLACWNRDGVQSGHKERWKIVPTCIWWTIWKERNQRCFENKSIHLLLLGRNSRHFEDKSNHIQKIKMNCLSLLYFWCKQKLMGGIEDLEPEKRQLQFEQGCLRQVGSKKKRSNRGTCSIRQG